MIGLLMNPLFRFRLTCLLAVCGTAVSSMSCASRLPPRVLDGCFEVASRLDRAWVALQDARAAGCAPDSYGVERCDGMRREIERLAQTCPSHPPALFANAILAYDARNLAQAQQWLDTLLAMPAPSPDAAALRARIAIEEGNLPFALRFLARQIRISGDHAGLREVYASALFLDHNYDDAGQQLEIAGKLGAPPFRILFHRALVLESQRRLDEAAALYKEALAANPGWPPAVSRLRAIESVR